MKIKLRKPEWPNPVFHSESVRKRVAAAVQKRKENPLPKRQGISRVIPKAYFSGGPPAPTRWRNGGVTTPKGKSGSGNSKWYRRVLAMREAA